MTEHNGRVEVTKIRGFQSGNETSTLDEADPTHSHISYESLVLLPGHCVNARISSFSVKVPTAFLLHMHAPLTHETRIMNVAPTR